MLSTATPPVSVSAVLEEGSRSSFLPSPRIAESSAPAQPYAAEMSTPEYAAEAGDEEDAPSPPDSAPPAKGDALRPGARDELIEILHGGPATKRRIADELNVDPTKAHVAQGPLETLLRTLVDEGLAATVMLGDPQELHHRLVEAVATPTVVLDRRTRILATIACNALSSIVPSELDDVAAIEPKDLDGLTLEGVLELGATFLAFKPDAVSAEGDLDALVKSGTLVIVDDAAIPSGPAQGDADEDEDVGDDDDLHDDEEVGDMGDTRERTTPMEPTEVHYGFAKGKLAEYLVKGGPALALLSLPEAAQATLRVPPAADDRTAFERTAAKLLDDERDAHARTKDKLARVYAWLKEKGIDTELLDGRLESALASPGKPAAPAGTKLVMRKKRVSTEKADVVRLLEELNDLASEESLLPQTIKDAQDRARDIIKAAKDAAKRRGEELSSLRQDKVAAAKENEMVVERRCRVEHDFATNTVRYIDVATGELFDVEAFAAGPLFEPKVDDAARAHAPDAEGAPARSEGAPPPRTDEAPVAGVPAPASGAPANDAEPAGATMSAAASPASPVQPGFTRKPDAPGDAAAAAVQADDETKRVSAARTPRTGKKVTYTVQSFEAHATAVLRATGAEGLPTSDLLPRVLAEAGLTETPKGIPALIMVAEKNLKANRLVQERDGRLVWVGPAQETPAAPVGAKHRGRGKRDNATASGKASPKAARAGKRR